MQFRGIAVPLQPKTLIHEIMAKNVLIAYYSRRGENYVNGSIKNLKLGNTEVVAQKIKALLPDADV